MSGFADDVRILAADGTESAGATREWSALPVGEAGTAVHTASVNISGSGVVVTRSLSGSTKIWSIDDVASPADDDLGTITALATARQGAVAATDGTNAVHLWWPGQASPRLLDHGEPVETLAVTTAGVHAATVVALGDALATAWTAPLDPNAPTRAWSWTIPEGLTDRLAVGQAAGLNVVAAAGPEGLQIWQLAADDGSAHIISRVDVPIATMTTVDTGPDRFSIAVVDEDDVLHVVTAAVSGVEHRRRNAESGSITTCLALSDPTGAPGLFTAAYDGTISVWDLARPDLPLRHRTGLPERPSPMTPIRTRTTQLVAFPTPAGALALWDPYNSRPTRLIDTGLGRLTHLVAVGSPTTARLVGASTSGVLLAVDPDDGSTAEFTVNCEFSHLAGLTDPTWAVASHGAALIAVKPPTLG